MKGLLAFPDGTVFHGVGLGAAGTACGELVFNTAMSGYQEVLTDPSYARQIVNFTYPHIGNTGCNSEDMESAGVYLAAIIIRSYLPMPSSWRMQQTLSDFLIQHNIPAISDLDTRHITELVRQRGAVNVCVQVGDELDPQAAINNAGEFPGIAGMDLAEVVTSKEIYPASKRIQHAWNIASDANSKPRFRVAAYDFGIKYNILRHLHRLGCEVMVYPARTPVETILKSQPDGVFLSNGPGDPRACDYAVAAIRRLLTTNIPIFGICLGHQLIALAAGAEIEKMKFGHNGINHPIVERRSGKVMISSQNHGFVVSEKTFPDCLEITHHSLFDNTIAGIRHRDQPVYSFQGHPEASPGPHDCSVLFKHFISLMEAGKSNADGHKQ